MQMSPGMFRLLRRLCQGPIPHPELRKMDQRPLRAAFYRGWFTLTARLEAHVTNDGWEAHKAYLGQVLRRKVDKEIFERRLAQKRRMA